MIGLITSGAEMERLREGDEPPDMNISRYRQTCRQTEIDIGRHRDRCIKRQMDTLTVI